MVGLAVVGFVVGAIAVSISELLTDSAAGRTALARLGGPGTVIDQYLVGMMMLLGVVASALAVHATLRVRTEERDGRAELLLAMPVDRVRWAAGHLALALVNGTVGVTVAGAAIGLGLGLTTGDLAADVPRALSGALVQLPVVWLFTGVVFGLFGWVPRLAAGAFAVALASLFFGWITGEVAPDHWARNLSVFEYVPQLPGGAFTLLPLAVMTLAAAALALVGVLGLRRRDLPVA